MYKIYDDTDLYWNISTKREALKWARRFRKDLGTDGRKVWIMSPSGKRIDF